jgi:yecA family protein
MANTFRPRSGGTHAAPSVSAPQPPACTPLDEHEIDALQDALDAVPAPLEPLDVSMVDGFLCGVLLQPQPVAEAQWLPHITDADGRALPASFDAAGLHALVRRRHAELSQAIADRQWFDPWVFEMEEGDDPDDEPTGCDAVYPWVAGFATAQEFFPALMRLDSGHGEIKSMRTAPDHLRKGVAAALLEHAIGEARIRGYQQLSLETGSGPSFEPALALYRKRGFLDGAAFGDYQPTAFNQFLHLDL